MAQGLMVMLGTIVTELPRALSFLRGWLGPGVMPLTRRGHQQFHSSSMGSVMDQDICLSGFVSHKKRATPFFDE